MPTLRAPLALVLAATGCRSGPPAVAVAPSLLPNLGVAASLAQPLHAGSAWHAEARFTDQFLDDKTFADNGFPEAGNWTQLDLGFERAPPPDADGRAWTTRFGVVGFDARGEPNIVEVAGHYVG